MSTYGEKQTKRPPAKRGLPAAHTSIVVTVTGKGHDHQACATDRGQPTRLPDKPEDTLNVLKNEQYAHYDDAHHDQKNRELSSVRTHKTPHEINVCYVQFIRNRFGQQYVFGPWDFWPTVRIRR